MSMQRYSPVNGDKCGGEYEHCQAEMQRDSGGDYVELDAVLDLLADMSEAIKTAIDTLRDAQAALTKARP